jgi:uncharacterized cupin superfamily protein
MTAIATAPAPLFAYDVPADDRLECFTVGTVEQPDAPRAPARVHARLDVQIDVLDGIVYLVADGDETVLRPGDRATIRAGVRYRRWNAGEDEARWIEAYSRA